MTDIEKGKEMSRPIKFQALVVKNIQISSHGFIPVGEWLTWYPLSFVPSWKEYIDPETIRQSTGLLDKNGVEIWEGDVLRYGDRIGSIEYETDSARFWFTDTDGWPDGLIDKDDIDGCIVTSRGEVIGNIYQNKELLR